MFISVEQLEHENFIFISLDIAFLEQDVYSWVFQSVHEKLEHINIYF